jgi:hypothetical protein
MFIPGFIVGVIIGSGIIMFFRRSHDNLKVESPEIVRSDEPTQFFEPVSDQEKWNEAKDINDLLK